MTINTQPLWVWIKQAMIRLGLRRPTLADALDRLMRHRQLNVRVNLEPTAPQ